MIWSRLASSWQMGWLLVKTCSGRSGSWRARYQQVELASALAEEAYEKSIALDPKNTGSRMLLAALLLQREAYARALDQL